MSKAKTINLLVILFMILGFASLFAQGSVLCSYCNKGTTSGKYYCTHCGTWWVSPDNIIKTELGVNASYDKTDYKDIVYSETGGIPTDKKVFTYDLAFQASFKYYFDSRYQHPIVPFSFIPYNYHSNFIKGGALTNNGDGFTPVSDFFEKHNSESKSFWFNGEYHFNKIFFGGNLLYSKAEFDVYNASNRSERSITFGGIGGYYNSRAKIGLEFQYKDEKDEQKDWEDQKQYIRLKPLVEFLPFPTLMLGGGIDYLFEVDSDFYEYLIPVKLKMVTIDNWWEFEVSLIYYNNNNSENRLGFAAEIEKLFRNSSIFIRPQFYRDKNSNTNTRFIVGGTKALMSRKLLITVASYYGSGQDIERLEYDVDELGGNISLKAFF